MEVIGGALKNASDVRESREQSVQESEATPVRLPWQSTCVDLLPAGSWAKDSTCTRTKHPRCPPVLRVVHVLYLVAVGVGLAGLVALTRCAS